MSSTLEAVVAAAFPVDGPGGAVLIQRGERRVYQACRGLAQVEHGVPWTPTTRTRIYSVTKSFCGLAALMLEDRGLLALDADCREVLPELDAVRGTITPRHLLNNTSGLRDYEDLLLASGISWFGSVTLEQQIELLERQRRGNFAPGDDVLYCNSGFRLFDVLLERRTCLSFRDWMQQGIFSRAGMDRAEVIPYDSEIVPGLAQGYEVLPLEGHARYRLATHYGSGGDGAIVATLDDMAAWDLAVRRGAFGVKSLRDRWSAAGVPARSSGSRYGLGVCHDRLFGHDCLHHTGGSIGFRSAWLWFPDLDLGVVVLANRHPFDIHAFIERLMLAAWRELALPGGCEPLPRPPEALAAGLEGVFVDPESGTTLPIVRHTDWPLLRTPYIMGGISVPDAQTLTATLGFSAAAGECERGADGRVSEIRLAMGRRRRIRLMRAGPQPAWTAESPGVEGRYRSDELLADVRIASIDARLHLLLGQAAGPDQRLPVTKLSADVFEAGPISFRALPSASHGTNALMMQTRGARDIGLARVV